MELTLEELKEKSKLLKDLPSRRKLSRKYDWDKEQYEFICKRCIEAAKYISSKIIED